MMSTLLVMTLIGHAQKSPYFLWGAGLDGSTYQKTGFYSQIDVGLLIEAPLDPGGSRLPIVFGWRGGGIPGLKIQGNGNIGVNTNNPQAVLDVNGQAIIRGEGNTLTLKKSNNYPALSFQGANGISLIESGDDYMKAYVGGNTRLTIQSNGSIGMGTENPTERFSVNGNIRAKEVKVETANWPDYVFEENYKITSLPDLEKFIKINKHLPEMPSAKEIETNGLKLGEINKKLLQKMEELTLHLIEKDKMINQSKAEIMIHKERLYELEQKYDALNKQISELINKTNHE